MSEGSTVHLAPAWAPGAALVTFDRPDALNAVDARVLADLEAVVARLEADDETAVVVLTGAGKGFKFNFSARRRVSSAEPVKTTSVISCWASTLDNCVTWVVSSAREPESIATCAPRKNEDA